MTDEYEQAIILRTDGASRGNPGPSAAGVVIEFPGGEMVACGKKYLGVMTNNHAEYQALILGLKAVARYRPSVIVVFMDSQLVVRQMRDEFTVNEGPLMKLFIKARSEIKAMFPASLTFEWVRRDRNVVADGLANDALDARTRIVNV